MECRLFIIMPGSVKHFNNFITWEQEGPEECVVENQELLGVPNNKGNRQNIFGWYESVIEMIICNN